MSEPYHKLSGEPDDKINPTKIMWWLLSVITSILLVAGAAWASNLAARVDSLEDKHAQVQQQLGIIEGKIDILLGRLK